jgi:hypothetical protein
MNRTGLQLNSSVEINQKSISMLVHGEAGITLAG